MNLKQKEQRSVSHVGYGAGSGHIINEEYECPCGKGTVFLRKR